VIRATDKLDYATLDEVLDELAVNLGGGVGDLVVVALRLAGRSGGRQVRGVLDATARTAYNEAEMLRRIEVARQSPRTSARLVTGITVVAVLGTVLFFRDWVEPYGTPSGQVVLAFMAAWCGAALWWMSRMTNVRLPARFTARPGLDQ
jgi:Flp pilus assembly protein TadB